MNKLLLTLLSVIIVGSVFAESEKAKKPKKPKLEAGMYAKFNHADAGTVQLRSDPRSDPQRLPAGL